MNMRNLVVFGAGPGAVAGGGRALDSVTIDGVDLRCGIVRTRAGAFDPDAPEHRGDVLVRVNAFSCNYRDKGFGYSMTAFPAHRFFAIGSEFAGEVVEVGADVTSLRPGDRVLADNAYFGGSTPADPGAERQGILTNRASKELQALPADRLLAVPEEMSDEVAAAFSVGAQTSYSMVRRSGVGPGANVLVTSARSNTSLFLITALRALDVAIYASTTSPGFEPRLRELGVEEVVRLDRGENDFARSERLAALADDLGGFDAVLDPMYDVHLAKAVLLLAPFGRYITCGYVGQNPGSRRINGLEEPLAMGDVMDVAIAKNLTIEGNCLGRTGDLEAALDDHRAGRLPVVIDSVHEGDGAGRFLDRSFNDRSRFGKVVFRYASA